MWLPANPLSTGDTKEDGERETTCWRERRRGRGWARIQIIRPQKSLVLYKLFNTLWSGGRNLLQIFLAMGTYFPPTPLPLPPPTLKPRISPINRKPSVAWCPNRTNNCVHCKKQGYCCCGPPKHCKHLIMWTYHRMQSWFKKYFRTVWLNVHPTFCSCAKNLKEW